MRVANAESFFTSVLDSLPQQIAVIDADGTLQWVNRAWKCFFEENGGSSEKVWHGTSYLQVCSLSAQNGDSHGEEALTGIAAVLRRQRSVFYYEYPCHSPAEQRWFMMCVRPIDWDGPNYFVVTHQDITKRKLSELRSQEMAVQDSLTGIASRRHFDDFLVNEWQRAQRLGHPLSMALLDVDFFKHYNDEYGHLAGDDCLRRVGEALKANCRRPGDLAARYGGDEFAVIFGNTSSQAAYTLAVKIRDAVQSIGISHENARQTHSITVSVGVATLYPMSNPATTPRDLISVADQALYQAKDGGRNRVCAQTGHLAPPEPISEPTRKRSAG